MVDPKTIDKMRLEFLRLQTQFAIVVQEMETDLKRMRDNERIPQEVINKKDEQIETLLQFNNKMDDILNLYRLSLLNVQAELISVNSLLWQSIKSNDTAFSVLMGKAFNNHQKQNL